MSQDDKTAKSNVVPEITMNRADAVPKRTIGDVSEAAAHPLQTGLPVPSGVASAPAETSPPVTPRTLSYGPADQEGKRPRTVSAESRAAPLIPTASTHTPNPHTCATPYMIV